MATILIIEDDKETNDAICEHLKSAGHNTFSAYDGGEALDAILDRATKRNWGSSLFGRCPNFTSVVFLSYKQFHPQTGAIR